MAHPHQLVCFVILVVDLVCLAIASHPTAWRRQSEDRVPDLHPLPQPQEEDSTLGDNSNEMQSGEESSEGTRTPNGSDTTPPSMSRCPTCWMQEQQKQFRIESIKRHILKQLKMTHPPNVTAPDPKNPAIRNMMSHHPELSNMNPSIQSDGPQPEEESKANLERILIFAKRPTQMFDTMSTESVYFNVAEKTSGYRVTSAKLYFYITPAEIVQTTLHTMVIERIMAPAKHGGMAKLRTEAVIKVQLSVRTGEWRSVDFTEVVQGWAMEPETNLGVILRIHDDAGNSVVVTDTSPEESKRPFLQLRLEDASRSRRKRQVDRMCTEDQQERDCCLYPIVVDFEQFGWDWIIAPKQYQANYCFGGCPNHYVYQYPHTQLISQMERMAVAGPCCSPSQMRSISLLMFDEQLDIIFAELPDMAVEQCNCS